MSSYVSAAPPLSGGRLDPPSRRVGSVNGSAKSTGSSGSSVPRSGGSDAPFFRDFESYGSHRSNAASGTSAGTSGSAKPRRKPQHVRFGHYILGSTLGEGEFGKVKLAWKKAAPGDAPGQVAIKLIRRESIPAGSDRENKVFREINALRKLRHPNIVGLQEVIKNDKFVGIVLEYASGGELFDYILAHKHLKDSVACKLFAQLVSGVDYMHSKGIIHRDLKLENLLLDKHRNIVITDFGFVNSFKLSSGQDLMKTSCGSPCYAAPELVVSADPYSGRKVDAWSCGVILYAMLAGYLPFDDDPRNPDGSNIAQLYQYILTSPLTFPAHVQPMPRDLIRRLLVPDPRARAALPTIKSHRWLAPHAALLSVAPKQWDAGGIPRATSSVTHADRRLSLGPQTFRPDRSAPARPYTSASHAVVIPASQSTPSIANVATVGTAEAESLPRSATYVTLAAGGGAGAGSGAGAAPRHARHQSVSAVPSSASAALLAVATAADKAQAQRQAQSGLAVSASARRHSIHGTAPGYSGANILGGEAGEQLLADSSDWTESAESAEPAEPAEPAGPAKPVESAQKVAVSARGMDPPKVVPRLPGPGARKPRPTSFNPAAFGTPFGTPFAYDKPSGSSESVISASETYTWRSAWRDASRTSRTGRTDSIYESELESDGTESEIASIGELTGAARGTAKPKGPRLPISGWSDENTNTVEIVGDVNGSNGSNDSKPREMSPPVNGVSKPRAAAAGGSATTSAAPRAPTIVAVPQGKPKNNRYSMSEALFDKLFGSTGATDSAGGSSGSAGTPSGSGASTGHRKRFSFLGFSYGDDTTAEPSAASVGRKTTVASSKSAKKDSERVTYGTNSASSSSSAGSRVLEPSTKNNLPSGGVSAGVTSTAGHTAGSAGRLGSAGGVENKPKEPVKEAVKPVSKPKSSQTTKKVMDFFKRRSRVYN